jgi:hypothetical protein
MKGFIAAGLVLAGASFASAQGETAAQAPVIAGAITVAAVDAVAKVLKADPTLRTVTINDPQGRKVTIDIPPEVPLAPIKKGALLDVRFVEAEALAIGKPGALPAETAEQNVTFAPAQGGTPSEIVTTTKRVTGMVADIDRSKRELTLQGPGKKSITLKVIPAVSGFDDIKIGDTAVIDYTEAVALTAVEHAAGKPNSSNL